MKSVANIKNYVGIEDKKEIVEEIIKRNMVIDSGVVLDIGEKDLWGELLIAKYYLGEDIDINAIDKHKEYDRIKKEKEGRSLWKLNDDTELLEKMYENKKKDFVKWVEHRELEKGISDKTVETIINEIIKQMENSDTSTEETKELIGEMLLGLGIGNGDILNERAKVQMLNVSKRTTKEL